MGAHNQHCQVVGCRAVAGKCKAYCRMHLLCLRHMKQPVGVAGQPCRWCRQCAKFSPLSSLRGDYRSRCDRHAACSLRSMRTAHGTRQQTCLRAVQAAATAAGAASAAPSRSSRSSSSGSAVGSGHAVGDTIPGTSTRSVCPSNSSSYSAVGTQEAAEDSLWCTSPDGYVTLGSLLTAQDYYSTSAPVCLTCRASHYHHGADVTGQNIPAPSTSSSTISPSGPGDPITAFQGAIMGGFKHAPKTGGAMTAATRHKRWHARLDRELQHMLDELSKDQDTSSTAVCLGMHQFGLSGTIPMQSVPATLTATPPGHSVHPYSEMSPQTWPTGGSMEC